MRIFMSGAAHLAYWSTHTISDDDFGVKPVYRLPPEQNAHPNQLVLEGLEIQRSNHLRSIGTASGAGGAEPASHDGVAWNPEQRGCVFTAAWTFSNFRSVANHRFIISPLCWSLETGCNNHLKPSVCVGSHHHPVRISSSCMIWDPVWNHYPLRTCEMIRDLPNALSLAARNGWRLEGLDWWQQ